MEKSFYNRKAWIYWVDLTATLIIGFVAFSLSCVSGNTILWAIALVVSCFAFYRAIYFLHEIAHFNEGEMRSFEWFWNALVGVPFLMPSILYRGVHSHHHHVSSYGTSADPEYNPIANQGGLKVILFMLSGLLIPHLLAIRFMILSPVGWLFPKFHLELENWASSLTMLRPKWKRANLNGEQRKQLYLQEISIWMAWAATIFLLSRIGLASVFLVNWYLAYAFAGCTNQIRTAVSHGYSSRNGTISFDHQIRDSLNIRGGILSELWAPLGSRFHGVHHLYPQLPYHVMGKAYHYSESRHRDGLAMKSSLIVAVIDLFKTAMSSEEPKHHGIRK